MSKERLKDIKFLNITEAIRCLDHKYNGEYRQVNIGEIVKDVDWLIEQVERVEQHKKIAKLNQKERQRLRRQNNQYRAELNILGEVINSASNADELNEEYERLKALEGSE